MICCMGDRSRIYGDIGRPGTGNGPAAMTGKAAVLPQLGPGQVFAMKSGWVFHTRACQIVRRTWEFNPSGLLVVDAEGAEGRRECGSCLAGKSPG